MTMLWPGFLLMLGVVPLLLGLYIWQLRRRRRYAVRYSSLSLVRAALGPQSRWRRHVPVALFLLALACLVLALSRPVMVVQVPSNQTAIILAMDVSGSMCATDIPPTRLAAAQDAARSFIASQPAGTRIGIVAFAGFAELIQPPTTDQAALEAAIAGLTYARGTAIGSAILESLDAIAAENPAVAPTGDGQGPEPAPGALPAGSYAPEIIVVLTDGVTTTGAPPLEAAQAATERGVRVYTIGFGTANPQGTACPGRFGGGGPGQGWGGGQGGGGGGFRRAIDEPTLQQIAAMTDGAYYAATSAGELQRVFAELPLSFTTRPEATEVSFAFAALGALLAAVAVAISLLRQQLL